MESEKDVKDFIAAYRGENIKILLRRGNDIKEISATPRISAPEGEGPLGIAMARLTLARTPWYKTPIEGGKILFRSMTDTIKGLAFLLRQLFTRDISHVAVSGPVGIFFFARDTRSLGISYFLQFVGTLSVNLAILNFLPIPALDGGRILFLAIEKVRGKPVKPRVEGAVHTVGFFLLVLLMVAVTYKDILTLF